MNSINEKDLIESGGKEWKNDFEAGNSIKRIYFNDDVLVKYFKFELLDSEIRIKFKPHFHSIKNTKTYYDTKNKIIISDEGRVRTLFNCHGITARARV